MINKVKAFLSFTKGEGYGRPLAEAAITGKPVIVLIGVDI
jgi:glycosyltransferase involved in cell wall biosynthesis